MFKDERLLLAPIPPQNGEIHSKLGLRNTERPFVSITLDEVEPPEVAPNGDDSCVAGRRWKLTLGIVGRVEDNAQETDTMSQILHIQNRRFTETTAMACLQNALNWGK